MIYKFSISLNERILKNQVIISFIEKSHNFYFLGISGIGMSALAILFREIGKKISGSSDIENEQTKKLKNEGVKIYIGHKRNNINPNIDLIIKSEAVLDDNVEILEAIKLNIPIITYGEGLSYFFNMFKSVAITGTHGKSSVTGIIVDALWETNKISYLAGTNVKKTGKNGAYKGILFIGEACEYKETFLNFYPDNIIIPSLEIDHIDYYKNGKNYLNAFKDFVLHLKGDSKLIMRAITAEEIELVKFVVSIPFIKNYFFYSRITDFNFLIKNFFSLYNNQKLKDIFSNFYFYNYTNEKKEINGETYFLIKIYKIQLEKIDFKNKKFIDQIKNINPSSYNNLFKMEIILLFPLPSEEYAANITSVYIFLKNLGFNASEIKSMIKNYKGIERRFDIMGHDKNKNIVITDYAHHPSEVKTFLKMVKQKYPDKQIISIFQSHQYSRTYYLFNEFIKSFDIPDYVIFLPIYRQRDTEEDIKKVSHKMLCSALSKKRKNVYCFDYEKELFNFLENFKNSVILFIGAGSIINIANKYINLNI